MRDINFDNGYSSEWFYAPRYDELVNSLEFEIVLESHDDDYQGDSRYLLRDGEKLGLLDFGWGSCSGCDSLEACDSREEVIEIRDSLNQEIHWEDDFDSMARYVHERDWEGQYGYYSSEGREWVATLKKHFSKEK